jgi:formylglycine-generating enzyme required for sulfatase activity
MTARLSPHLACFLGLSLGESATASPAVAQATEPSPGIVTRAPARSSAVYLRPLAFEMGSSEPEVLSALVSCKREPLPERCDETTFANEMPAHRERVVGFWMARTEVTVAAYARCVAAGRCAPAGFEGGGLRFAQPELPVTFVSFDDARRYCAFRGGRLPTEAEFERAARGAPRRAYPWGKSFNGKLANHGRLGVDAGDASDGYAELSPVGSFPDGATPEGILDLAGNAAEWTLDLYTADYGSPGSPGKTGERTVRGGSFASAAAFLRGAARAGRPPQTREPTLGFRCVWAVRPLRE